MSDARSDASNPLSNVKPISPEIAAAEPARDQETDREIPTQSIAEDPKPAPPPEKKKGRSMGGLAILLAVLLLGSIALNVRQATVTETLSVENQRFSFALNEAVATLDQETARANSAESALGGITGAVDNVNNRIEALQQALGELRAATHD
jgi:hypothetical protein